MNAGMSPSGSSSSAANFSTFERKWSATYERSPDKVPGYATILGKTFD